MLVLAYASLYPFQPLRLASPEAIALYLRPKGITGFDVALNFVAYIPLGALLVLVLRAAGRDRPISRAASVAFGFSFVMETAQLFIPFRVASMADVAANSAGALAGALLFLPSVYRSLTGPLAVLRERIVVPGPWGDAGLALLALWIIAQLNPALPFFETGNIGSPGDTNPYRVEWSLLMLQVIAVALSACGFGLFVSALLNGPGGALRFTAGLLTAALWFKFITAAVMLKAPLSADWVNEARVIGLAAGMLLFIPLRALGRPARTYLAIVFVLAGALFAKVVGDYSPLDDLLRVFNWPHGQLTTFATLTRYLHEIWPLLALAFLIASFVSRQRSAVR
ncbi:hypothetical protein BWI17_06625 [Betaproteobacteria bacterium GR16-43]|nr:hypothetical protein BWI17_06625 [Betaproteobacteria bacterium GR16-43]